MPPHHIVILLFERFSNHCLANAIEPLRVVNSLTAKTHYSWEYVTLDGTQVSSSSGLPVSPSRKLSQIEKADDLFILSSYDHARLANDACSRALRQASKRVKRIVGMDTGAWLMAKAELLGGYSATAHWDILDEMAEAFPEIDVLEDRFVKHEFIATTGGVSTAFDFILDMIEERHSALLRLEVAAFFRHGTRSRLSDPLLRATGHQRVDAAVALMRRNLETPLSLDEIARRLNVHPKKLTQIFNEKIGETPIKIYKQIRLREAKRLIEMSQLSIAEIGMRTGYQNPAAFARAFREEFGEVPREVRGR